MKITISKELLTLIPEFDVIAYEITFVDEYNVLDKNTDVDQELQAISLKLQQKYLYEDVCKITKLKFTRDGYKKLGKDPSHTRPAPEALLRRILKKESLYRLGDVIDLGNILSLETLRSVCVVDASKLVGDIVITKGIKEESFLGINRGIINADNLVVYKDELGIFGSTTSDTLRTMVTSETKKVLVMMICFDHSVKEQDEQILIDLYQKYTVTKNVTKVK